MRLARAIAAAPCLAALTGCLVLGGSAISEARASTAQSDLWSYSDTAVQRIERYWNAKQQRYGGSSFRLTVGMLTIYSNAKMAGYQGPSRNDARIPLLARQLTSWPAYITNMRDTRNPETYHPHVPGFTSEMQKSPGYQHVALDNVASEALGLAVKSGALSKSLAQEVGSKVYAVARGHQFSYPKVEANQVNWPIGVWLAVGRSSGRWGVAKSQVRRYMRAWTAGMFRPMAGNAIPNFSSGYGLNYWPTSPLSSSINQTSSTEYASVIFTGFDAYDEMVQRGMPSLSSSEQARMRTWARRIISGEWTHGGWPNWDSGYGYMRWQLVNYFAWCTEALGTIATSGRLVSATERSRARWLFHQALNRFTWMTEHGENGATRYGVASPFAVSSANLVTDMRLAAAASNAAVAELGAAGSTPGGWSWWDNARKRLTVSNPRYSSAMITPINTIGYGGLEPARFLDSQGRVLTTLGSTITQAGIRASVGGRVVGLTQGRYTTVLAAVKRWRPRRVGGGSPAIGGRAGPIIVSQHFSPEAITTQYKVEARNARTELRIPFWGKLTKKKVTPVSNGLKIETESSEGGKLEILVVSGRPLKGQWASIGKINSSPQTRTIFQIAGSSSGATTTTVVMRPLS